MILVLLMIIIKLIFKENLTNNEIQDNHCPGTVKSISAAMTLQQSAQVAVNS